VAYDDLETEGYGQYRSLFNADLESKGVGE
jgi:hypothetical protein